jgi:guanylate kinase
MNQFHLKHHQDFKETLANYQMSKRAIKALEGLKFILASGPSSSGRNTVIKYLVENYGYYFVISDTTRPPQIRDGKLEQNGVNYFFRSEEEMLSDLKAGEFLEAAIIHEQQVSGVSVRELGRAKLLNKVAITDIEIVGTDNIMKATNKAKAIFLVPPSFDEWMQRIHSRGLMSPQEIKNRLTSAVKEFETALAKDYYQFVVAENVEHTAAIIDAIAHNQRNPDHHKGQQLIEKLRQELNSKLESL